MSLPLIFKMDSIDMLFLSAQGLVFIPFVAFILFPNKWLVIAFTAVIVIVLIILFIIDFKLGVLAIWCLLYLLVIPFVIPLFDPRPILVLNEQGIKYGTIFTDWSNVRSVKRNEYKWGNELEIQLHSEQKVLDQYTGIKLRMILANSDEYDEPLLLSRIPLKDIKFDEEELIGIIEKYVTENKYSSEETM